MHRARLAHSKPKMRAANYFHPVELLSFFVGFSANLRSPTHETDTHTHRSCACILEMKIWKFAIARRNQCRALNSMYVLADGKILISWAFVERKQQHIFCGKKVPHKHITKAFRINNAEVNGNVAWNVVSCLTESHGQQPRQHCNFVRISATVHMIFSCILNYKFRWVRSAPHSHTRTTTQKHVVDFPNSTVSPTPFTCI